MPFLFPFLFISFSLIWISLVIFPLWFLPSHVGGSLIAFFGWMDGRRRWENEREKQK
jgi:hypothetical protein